MSQSPIEPNPYARKNPYATTLTEPSKPPGPPTGPSDVLLIIPAVFLLIMGGMSLALGIFQVVSVALNGVPMQPNQDPAQAAGFKFGFWASTLLIPVLNSVVVAGSIAMLAKKMHGLAIAGAICGLVPVCGPCFILGMPFGIWALVQLLDVNVKERFT